MKKFFFILCLAFLAVAGHAQNFRGQWKGYFIDQSQSALSFGSNRCDYVIELDIDGDKVSGYSYTYFTGDGNKYYTICTLVGVANKKDKTLRVTETSRTKTNVPDNISNSFQVHTLHWRKDGENEILEGKWVPAPGQDVMNTGFGTTYLEKRQLSEISLLAKKVNARKDPQSGAFASAKKPGAPNKPGSKPLVTNKPRVSSPMAATGKRPTAKPLAVLKTKPNSPIASTVRKPAALVAATTPKKPIPHPAKPVLPKVTKDTTALAALEVPVTKTLVPPRDTVVAPIPVTSTASIVDTRNHTLLRTVEVDNPTVKVELYDDGIVDGDSVSIIYNGQVLLAHKMLSEKAISFDLPVPNDAVNELIMYADNLGTYPPNTALMVITDGTKRYEVRITSDLSRSGTIRFVHRGANTNSANASAEKN